MSNKKSNNFSKLFEYFNEDEESEEEIENYEKNYNELLKTKENRISEENININDKNKEKENKIIEELYSDNNNNYEENEDNDVFYFEEKDINDNEINDFDKIKFASFKPKCFTEDISNEENLENNNNKSNKFNNLNKENNKTNNNEVIYQKIISVQNSFGNIDDTFNRSTSLQTEKIAENSHSKFNQETPKAKEEYKPEYLINSEIFDEIENKIQTNKKDKNHNKLEWKDRKVLVKKNVNQLKLYMKKNIKLSINKSKSKSKEGKKIKNTNKKNNIELILYEDALKKRKKEDNINRNTISEYKLSSTRSKLNKELFQVSMRHDDKKIETILKKYSNELNIIDIGLIFAELKIFRKLLQNINTNKLRNINNIEEFKNIISIVIKDNEIRKKHELDFLEQIWNLLYNKIKDKIFVEKEIFEGFLKILFSSIGSINDTSNILEQYIKAATFIDNLDKNKIKNCIKNFFKLKENIIAYKNIQIKICS